MLQKSGGQKQAKLPVLSGWAGWHKLSSLSVTVTPASHGGLRSCMRKKGDSMLLCCHVAVHQQQFVKMWLVGFMGRGKGICSCGCLASCIEWLHGSLCVSSYVSYCEKSVSCPSPFQCDSCYMIVV